MKYFYILLFLVFTLFHIFPKGTLIKRSVAILPIYNASLTQENNYLQTTIADTLKSQLEKTETFRLLDMDAMKQRITDEKIAIDEIIFDDKAIKIGELLNAEVLIYGYFQIGNKKIQVNLIAMDIRARQKAVIIRESGNFGLDILDTVDMITAAMSEKMKDKLPPYKPPLAFNQKLGLGFIISGSSMMTVALPVFICNFVLMYPFVQSLIPGEQYSPERYKNYDTAFSGYIAMFVFSVSTFFIGAVFLAAGIPVYILKAKKKKSNKIGWIYEWNQKNRLTAGIQLSL